MRIFRGGGHLGVTVSCQSSLKSIGKNWNSYLAIWSVAVAKKELSIMQNISEGQLGVTELPGQPQG